MEDFGASVREDYIVHVERSKSTGMVLREEWMCAGQEHYGRIHRVGAPAELRYDPKTGRLLFEHWRTLSKSHREDGPASRWYSAETGALRYEGWALNDYAHREGDAPSSIYWYSNGMLQLLIFEKHGKKHRNGGPAYIELDQGGAIMNLEWYQDGVKVEPPLGFSHQAVFDYIPDVVPSP